MKQKRDLPHGFDISDKWTDFIRATVATQVDEDLPTLPRLEWTVPEMYCVA